MISLKTTASIKDYLLRLDSSWSDDPTVMSKLKVLQKRCALHDRSLFFRAAQFGLPVHIDAFIQSGYNIYEEYDLVGSAVSRGNLPTMRYLLRLGCSVDRAMYRLPKHFSRNQIDELIDEIIDAGGNLNRGDHRTSDPLNQAVSDHKPVVVRAMLDRGLDPNYKYHHDENALDAISLSMFCNGNNHRYESEELERSLVAVIDILMILKNAGLSLNGPSWWGSFHKRLARDIEWGSNKRNEYLARLKKAALEIEPFIEE